MFIFGGLEVFVGFILVSAWNIFADWNAANQLRLANVSRDPIKSRLHNYIFSAGLKSDRTATTTGMNEYGYFLKWWYPTTMGFLTKIYYFGVFWGYHHLRDHPYIDGSSCCHFESVFHGWCRYCKFFNLFTWRWCLTPTLRIIAGLVIQSDLFGMVKWTLSKVKWPPTRGWKGHFESPGVSLSEKITCFYFLWRFSQMKLCNLCIFHHKPQRPIGGENP